MSYRTEGRISVRPWGAGALFGVTGLGGGNVWTFARTDGWKFPPLFYRTLSPSGPLPYLDFSIEKDGQEPVMVSSTLRPAVHILGSQNVYSGAEGIADHYWPCAVFSGLPRILLLNAGLAEPF